MSSRQSGSVIIRLDLRGQEELKRRLEELGPAGKRLGRELEQGMKPVAKEGKLAKASLDELGGSIRSVTNEAGPFGRVLGGLGPLGLGAAAGLGVLALAVREVFVLMGRGREVAQYASDLDTIAASAGMTRAAVQDVGQAVALAGGDFDRGTASLEEFSKRLGRVRALGQGEAFDALKTLGLSAASLDGLTAEQSLERVLDRLMEIDDVSQRIALADRLGLSGMDELLRRSASEMRTLRVEAERMNAVLSDATLTRLAAVNDQIDRLERRRALADQVGGAAMIELELRRQQIRTEGAEAYAAILSLLIPMEERSTAILQEQITFMESRSEWWARMLPGLVGLAAQFADTSREAAQLLGVTDRLNESLAQGALADAQVRAADIMIASMGLDPTPEQTLMTLTRRRELESLVASSLRQLMTPLQRVQQLEADLNEARAAGEEITQAQIAAIVRLTRTQLGLNAAQKEAVGIKNDPGAELRERERVLETFRQQGELEAARILGDDARVQALEDEAALRERITAYQAEGFKIEEAQAAARADMDRLAAARAQAQAASLDALRESHELTLARLRGETDRVALLEREAAIRADMERGLSRDVAETRANEREAAAQVGEFRDAVTRGLRSGLDAFVQTGDLDALGRGMASSFLSYTLDGLVDALTGQAADFLFGGFDAAAEGAAHGSAASVPMAAAITTSGATAATAMGTAIVTAGAAAAAQMAAAVTAGSVVGSLLPGLDRGGDILIGGRGGIDNNLLSINNRPVARVSADEKIRVVPRFGGGGAAPTIINQYFQLEGAVTTDDLMRRVEGRADSAAARAADAAVQVAEGRAGLRARKSAYSYGRR